MANGSGGGCAARLGEGSVVELAERSHPSLDESEAHTNDEWEQQSLIYAGRKPQHVTSDPYHQQQHGRIHLESRSTSTDPGERVRFWIAMFENAAASEVAMNVCLPWLLCEAEGGIFKPPPRVTLNILVLIFNTLGSFAEGFFKSSRLLTQTLRSSKEGHNVVFNSSEGICSGFLNVFTSFPDVGDGGSNVVQDTESYLLGFTYCLANMIGGVACYKLGRTSGWQAAGTHWLPLVNFCRLWPYITRGLILAALFSTFLDSKSTGVNMPLDLTSPHLIGIDGVRLEWDEYEMQFSPSLMGLAFGIFMSASGSALGIICCDMLFHENARPAARLVANAISTVLVILVNHTMFVGGNEPVFVLIKFATSFCGALSAFSGTIGDVTDSYFEHSQDEHLCDDKKRRRHAPLMSALQNFFSHLAMTVVVMLLGVYWASEAKTLPPIILGRPRRKRIAHTVSHTSWHVPKPPEV